MRTYSRNMQNMVYFMIILLSIFGRKVVRSDSVAEKRSIINDIINQTFPDGTPSLPGLNTFHSSDKSYVDDLCQPLQYASEDKRTACCGLSRKTKHLYNVLFEDEKMILFGGNNETHVNLLPRSVPPILSYKMRQDVFFDRKIEIRNVAFQPSTHCQSYFDGSLYIVKRKTAHNTYHSVSDNVLVTLSTILLDAYLRPDMLFKPRKLLVDYDHQLFYATKPSQPHSAVESGAVHMELLREMMSDGAISLKHLSGTCYRRVVWGTEPHTNYLLTLQTIRRKMAIFARLLADHVISNAIKANKPDWAQQTLFERGVVGTKKQQLVRDGRPLRVVIYTRGSSGLGRTIQNEALLKQELQSRGADVLHCCDFSRVGLAQQLYIARQADVIMGLHGAALVHGIFMNPGTVSLEMKTVYAYESILFFIIADARQGVHGQVDIRKYSTINSLRHRPIDTSLVARLMGALNAALDLQSNQTCSTSLSSVRNVNADFAGDIVVPPQCPMPAFSHPLGPLEKDTKAVCTEMVLTKVFTNLLNNKDGWQLHCDACNQ